MKPSGAHSSLRMGPKSLKPLFTCGPVTSVFPIRPYVLIEQGGVFT